jgi:hypothetical protein
MRNTCGEGGGCSWEFLAPPSGRGPLRATIRWFGSLSSLAPPANVSQAYGLAGRMLDAPSFFSVFAFNELGAHATSENSSALMRFDRRSYPVVRFARLASATGFSLKPSAWLTG